MAREHQRTLAVIAQRFELRRRVGRQFDAALVRMIGVEIPDVIEMREFCADTSKVIPHTHQNGVDLGG